MSIFDIFKKKQEYELPQIYKGIISKDDYNIILDFSLLYHKEQNLLVSKIDEGEIVIEINNEIQHRYLDNLVRVLSGNEKLKWKEIIFDHFNKLKYNNSAFEYLYKDFEYASQFLRVLIKGNNFNLGDDISNYVHRIDFPDTNTFLVLEFEEQFHYILKDEILEWEKTENELFETALENIPQDEIEIKVYEFAEKFKVFSFTSGDYSSSFMINLKNKADYVIGNFGSLVAIPTKGTALVYPIETNNILELIEVIDPTIEKFYNEDPGNITQNYYWFHNNKFRLFSTGTDEDKKFIKLPEALSEMFANKL
ncbi:hypothetical protein [Flavobacterium notoginsengisoli]|uniref:hypothetical protein n=1 Tax=Flavobacterium notoginsengisoli TaxID=1478199 RepID=UPI00364090AA